MVKKMDTQVTAESIERNFISLNRILTELETDINAIKSSDKVSDELWNKIKQELSTFTTQTNKEIKKVLAGAANGILDDYQAEQIVASVRNEINLSLVNYENERQLIFRMLKGGSGEYEDDEAPVAERGIKLIVQENDESIPYAAFDFNSNGLSLAFNKLNEGEAESITAVDCTADSVSLSVRDAADENGVGISFNKTGAISIQAKAEGSIAVFGYDVTARKWRFSNSSDLSPSDLGDMTKAVYDANDDGKIDRADTADHVPWEGVTEKPTTLHEFGIEDEVKSEIGKGASIKKGIAANAETIPLPPDLSTEQCVWGISGPVVNSLSDGNTPAVLLTPNYFSVNQDRVITCGYSGIEQDNVTKDISKIDIPGGSVYYWIVGFKYAEV